MLSKQQLIYPSSPIQGRSNQYLEDVVDTFFSLENDYDHNLLTLSNDCCNGETIFANGNFIASTPDYVNLLSSVVVGQFENNSFIVRDDKVTNVTIELNDSTFLDQYQYEFGRTFFGIIDPNSVFQYTKESKLKKMHIFFAIQPIFGSFRPELTPESLVDVQGIERVGNTLCVKVLFKSQLRPAHSLLTDKRRKGNGMRLSVIIAFRSPLSKITTLTREVDFRFRNNSGNSTSSRTYTKKRKTDYVDTPQTLDVRTTESIKSPSNTVQNTPFSKIIMPPSPQINRIYPDTIWAFEAIADENKSIMLIGNNLNTRRIRVFFCNPFEKTSCEAKLKPTLYNEKEYYIPPLKSFYKHEHIAIPEEGLTVNVLFRDDSGELGDSFSFDQKFTYKNLKPDNLFRLFGVNIPAAGNNFVNYTPNDNNYPSANSSPNYDYSGLFEGGNTGFNDINQYQSALLKPEIKDNINRTILHYAVQLGLSQLIEPAVNNGVEINGQDNYGCTAMHLAVYYGKPEMVKELAKYGARNNIKDCNGDTPFALAIKWKEYSIIDFFFQNDSSILRKIAESITSDEQTLIVNWIYSFSNKVILKWNLASIPYISKTLRKMVAILTTKKPDGVKLNSTSLWYELSMSNAEETVQQLFPSYKKQKYEDSWQFDDKVWVSGKARGYIDSSILTNPKKNEQTNTIEQQTNLIEKKEKMTQQEERKITATLMED